MTVSKFKTEIHSITKKRLTHLMKKAVSRLGNVYIYIFKVSCSTPLLLIIIISYTCPFYDLNMHYTSCILDIDIDAEDGNYYSKFIRKILLIANAS